MHTVNSITLIIMLQTDVCFRYNVAIKTAKVGEATADAFGESHLEGNIFCYTQFLPQ